MKNLYQKGNKKSIRGKPRILFLCNRFKIDYSAMGKTSVPMW